MGNDIIVNDFDWKIAGAAGDGILNAGVMFARVCKRAGLYVFATAEYPSLIRGGHNHLDVRVEGEDVYAHSKDVCLLVALNQESVEKHCKKILPGGGIIYDPAETKFDPIGHGVPKLRAFPIPLVDLAKENGGRIMRNTVAMGASIAFSGLDIELFNQVIRENFGKKGEEIVKSNIAAAKAGYEYAKKSFPDPFRYQLKAQKVQERLFMTGNEAISIGAIRAGCKFYAAYPMTPASSILSHLATLEKKFNLVVKHTEDELAAIIMAIGASYTGVRSMTGTSGGGFCLMTEGLGLAIQAETPLVIVEAQRPGPATGMATHTGQGDLRFVLHASTDEAPRCIIAPGDVNDCYSDTLDAFNIADKYQMPVIILTDKYLGESYYTAEVFDTENVKIDRGKLMTNEQAAKTEKYLRYKLTDDGVSPRMIPGQPNGMHVATSYEHDELGSEREEEEVRLNQMQKRYKKFENLAKELKNPEIIGPKDAEITLIGWGSTKGPIREAMRILAKQKITANYYQIKYISPLPVDQIKKVFSESKKTMIIENNYTGLLEGVLFEQAGVKPTYNYHKYDGRPFAPEDIAAQVELELKRG